MLHDLSQLLKIRPHRVNIGKTGVMNFNSQPNLKDTSKSRIDA
ncbi:hypothetical protein BRCON_0687 [Candidatus Sumerlaea chitinivorans]|uniref:Uncharacterized protein n=1 Tax=Sumerlaea chitinivorans TaxID=2250252 RepID=A0A2Z4Y2Z9_SUMC1|nr:hypothetical protein BRCON_0687 [Candidatus Sumerlaea chitinivorans]